MTGRVMISMSHDFPKPYKIIFRTSGIKFKHGLIENAMFRRVFETSRFDWLRSVFLTDKFVSRFSQHWDKISTNGLWHCVFPEFAYLGKLFIFFGNGRSRDRHVTNHVNAKWGL